MAEASGDFFDLKHSAKLGSVHIDGITVCMSKLTIGKVVYASYFGPMQTRTASSRVVECKAFFCP